MGGRERAGMIVESIPHQLPRGVRSSGGFPGTVVSPRIITGHLGLHQPSFSFGFCLDVPPTLPLFWLTNSTDLQLTSTL